MLCLAAAFAVARGGSAEAKDDFDDHVDAYEAKRRSDVTIGFSVGPVFGSATGYPNEADKIDNPDFRSATGVGTGTGGAFWLGGAFTDWFTFAIGSGGGSFSGTSLDAKGGAILLRIETFPLFFQVAMFLRQ